MDQISGSRPAPNSLTESHSLAHVNRQVSDCSRATLENQAIHS